MLRTYLVDDEPLALKRLSRLLHETGRISIVGQTREPRTALREVPKLDLDLLFVDIQMPELNGFELLKALGSYPPVVFVTAFDQFAIDAFNIFSVDYLMKPVEADRLQLTLSKLERYTEIGSADERVRVKELLKHFELTAPESTRLPRIPSRRGGRITMIDIESVTHFFAEDKVTFASNADCRSFPIDLSLNELENQLTASNFYRIHRGALVNLVYVDEVHGWFAGGIVVRLRDRKRTELAVSRPRVPELKKRLGI
ncbi:MAG: LytR/AlgR family response regulator transcription factor [Pyrinomonadaceae bacterium]